LCRIASDRSTTPERLAVGEGGWYPAVSRQGRLVYTREWTDSNIWRVELGRGKNGLSKATPFISSTRGDNSVQYFPDGRRIAFASERSGAWEIWVCDANGSNAVQLTSFGAVSGTPHWSPDGERITFDSNVEGQFEIYVISANGGKPRRLTTNPAQDLAPSFSRDGRWINFASNRTGRREVWRVSPDGGDAKQVTRNGGFAASESTDGKSLYYTKTSETSALWTAPASGGEERQLLEAVAWRAFSVVKDGIYFIPPPGSDGNSAIQFFAFATGKTRPIALIEKLVSYGLPVSPDERWILYSQVDQQIADLMLVENFH
jgi:Tol biopolymer transport system component